MRFIYALYLGVPSDAAAALQPSKHQRINAASFMGKSVSI